MGRVVNGILMVVTVYVVYRVGRSDGRHESDTVWMTATKTITENNE